MSGPSRVNGGLTQLERTTLDLLLMGATNKAVASRLNVSVRTVERYRSQALRKLGVHTLVEAASRRVLEPAGEHRLTGSMEWPFRELD